MRNVVVFAHNLARSLVSGLLENEILMQSFPFLRFVYNSFNEFLVESGSDFVPNKILKDSIDVFMLDHHVSRL